MKTKHWTEIQTTLTLQRKKLFNFFMRSDLNAIADKSEIVVVMNGVEVTCKEPYFSRGKIVLEVGNE